jgi:hypothetical protein
MEPAGRQRKPAAEVGQRAGTVSPLVGHCGRPAACA